MFDISSHVRNPGVTVITGCERCQWFCVEWLPNADHARSPPTTPRPGPFGGRGRVGAATPFRRPAGCAADGRGCIERGVQMKRVLRTALLGACVAAAVAFGGIHQDDGGHATRAQ